MVDCTGAGFKQAFILFLKSNKHLEGKRGRGNSYLDYVFNVRRRNEDQPL
jgi:hypothetical protein